MACCNLFEDLPSGSPCHVTCPLQATRHLPSVGLTEGGGPSLPSVPLSCLTQPILCQRLGSRLPGCSAQFVYSGGTLATGERGRTEEKEVAVTHTILFYGAADPAEYCLPQIASQKLPDPVPLTMVPPLIPNRGLRDGDFSVANLCLFVGVLSSCKPRGPFI